MTEAVCLTPLAHRDDLIFSSDSKLYTLVSTALQYFASLSNQMLRFGFQEIQRVKLFISSELSYYIIFNPINLLSLFNIASRYGHIKVITLDVTLEEGVNNRELANGNF
jgi:hypothetical protein